MMQLFRELVNEGGDVLPAGLVLVSGAPAVHPPHPIFRLPVFVLDRLKPTLTAEFSANAIHSSHEESNPGLFAASSAMSNQNPMHMCKAYYRQCKGLAPTELAEVSAPTLVVHGAEDKVLPPKVGVYQAINQGWLCSK